LIAQREMQAALNATLILSAHHQGMVVGEQTA
jgi:hypothetical protein